MRQLTWLFLFLQSLIGLIAKKECLIDYRSLENLGETKLAKDFKKCGYQWFHLPPAQNGSKYLQVKAYFQLQTFKYRSEEQLFSAYTRIFLMWNDERLTWDPKEYEGVEVVVLPNHYLWTPALKHMNSVDDFLNYNFYYYSSLPCEVQNSGAIRYVTSEVFEAKCKTDLSEWPYDTQTCKLEIGVHEQEGNKVLLDVGQRSVAWQMTQQGPEWDIINYQQEVNQTSDKQLIMSFRLRRHSDILSVIVVYPSLILSVLTLSTLFIDARRPTRLYVISFSLMCQFYSQSDLVWEMPKRGNDPPRILLYYRGSFIMTSIFIVLSFVLSFICKKETTCYDWIVSFNDFVYNKSVKFLIWPRWYSIVEEDKTTSKLNKYWIDFANIVNSVWIVVSVIVYIILYSVFMPHPIPIVY